MRPQPLAPKVSPKRRAALIGAGLAAAAILGVVFCTPASDPERTGATARAPGSEPHRAPKNANTAKSGGGAGPDFSDEGRAPEFDATVCWQDLERFDGAVTLASFRDWAAALLGSGDALVRDYLQDRLTELIGKDPEHALEVLGWAREAEGRSYGMYLRAVRDSEAVQQPQVAARLMDLGLDASVPSERRAGILSALDTQKRLTAPMLERLTRFAKDPASGEAGWAATRTIARVMKREHQRRGDIAPYLNDLLTIGAESPDEQIRYLGQMMPMHAAPLLTEEQTARFEKILTTEGNEDGRDAAAHNLSLSSDKARVLGLFAKTFETEPSVCVRWALFRFSARTAGKAALPVMANMALSDPRFQAPYRAFEQLYAAGTLDFVRVWQGLPNQDPFHCLDDHE